MRIFSLYSSAWLGLVITSISLNPLLKVGADRKSSEHKVYCSPCGAWRATEAPSSRGRSPKQRIVGGQKVEQDRPWMAYVEIQAFSKFHCGGSIINKRFVLTAAHCTCDALPCRVNDRDELMHQYEPKNKFLVYVGFRNGHLLTYPLVIFSLIFSGVPRVFGARGKLKNLRPPPPKKK